MAYLPPGMAERTTADKAARGRENTTDGDYIYLVKSVSYEEITTKTGTKEHALIIEHRVVESKPLPNQPDGVKPNAVGTDVGFFLPDYGKAKVMLTKNFKAWALGLLGLDEKTVDPAKLTQTLGLIGGPQQIARGMYIRGVTFHTTKRDDGGDFLGLNWYPVPGENHPEAQSVKDRRAALDLEAASETPATAPGNGAPAAAPAIPGAPTLPPAPPKDPLAGWTVHPQNAEFYYRGNEVKSKVDLLAGK